MIVGNVFWICVVAIILIAVWLSVVRVKERQKTIRFAIEKGYKVDSELIKLIDQKSPTNTDSYYSSGFICFVAGIGIIILGFFIRQIEIIPFYPLVGGGILTILVGLGLILFAYIFSRKNKSNN